MSIRTTRRFPLTALALACAMASPAWVQAEETEQQSTDQAAMQTESSSQSSSQSGSQTGSASGGLAALAEEQGDISTFAKVVEQAGMTEGLESGTYTIFAPTDDAFESSGEDVDELMKPENRDQLVSILRAHIVADDVDPEMAKKIGKAKTVDGGTVELKSDGDTLQIGDASVVNSDLQQGDLRIYTIDKVLTPNASASVASSTPSFDELDEDGDGYLNESELEAEETLASQQSELDSDGDDQISRTEFSAFEQHESEAASEESEDSSWFGGDEEEEGASN